MLKAISPCRERHTRLFTTICAICCASLIAQTSFAQSAQSEWVHPGPDGKLVYKTTALGDRIMDFSFAGYMGGGVALPDVPVKKMVKPSGGEDDTATIQAAIDEVSQLPLENGFRGAVRLEPGTFACNGTLTIRTSGVVIRGSGSGANGTTIKMTGSRHTAFSIGRGRGRASAGPTIDDNATESNKSAAPSADFTAAQTFIVDKYLPAGTSTFTVADPKSFAVGDAVMIRRPTTPAWVHFMGMDNLRRDGRGQTWIGTSRSENTERVIKAIDGDRITVDIPLADSFDATYLNLPGVTVSKMRPTQNISQVGIEHLHVQCPPLEVAYGQAPYSGARISGEDCWLRDVNFEETMNTTAISGRRITMQEVVVTHTYPNLGASKPTDFSIEGSEILIDRCKITGDNMYFVWTASLYPGPNVLLNCTFRGHGSRIQPHMRWSTGVLVDNCTVPDGGIDFPNRGVAGSGHGWTMGWAVAWNCIANTYVIQQPPGAANWAIGCIGTRVPTARYFDAAPILPEGIFDSHGTPVAPQSLYLAQLSERLGEQAIRNIGYPLNSIDMFPEKSTPLLPPLSQHDDPELGPNLALHRPINGGNMRGGSRQFAGEKAVDGNDETYWTPGENAARGNLEADTEGPLEINALMLSEPKDFAGDIEQYRVEGQVDSAWKLLAEGTTIGERKVERFPKITVWKVRLSIVKSQGAPAIREFGLYLVPESSNASVSTPPDPKTTPAESQPAK